VQGLIETSTGAEVRLLSRRASLAIGGGVWAANILS